MLTLFSRYLSVGVVNTAIHWLCFALLVALGSPQSWANLAGFAAAVTFSFFANARWTFRERATPARYGLFVAFMGALALLVGWTADRAAVHPLLTLLGFSAFSLAAGFLYSRLVVFRAAP